MLKLTLVVLSTLMSIVLLEGITHFVLPVDPEEKFKFFEYDQTFGWSNIKNFSGTIPLDEVTYQVRTNSLGMRDRERELSSPPANMRMAFVGDSFVWGTGVSEENRYTNLIESLYSGKVEALNFGVVGYSLVQYLLLLDQVIKFHPQVVVVSFCLANDFSDSVQWARSTGFSPYVAKIESNRPVIEGYPLPNSFQLREVQNVVRPSWLRQFHLYRVLERMHLQSVLSDQLKYGQRGLVAFPLFHRSIYRPELSTAVESRQTEQALEIAKSILSEMRARLRRENIHMVVLLAPSRCEYETCFHKKRRTEMNLGVRDKVVNILNDLEIEFIDPTAQLSSSDFWKTDGHWRPSGHQKLANILKDYIDRRQTKSRK